MTNTTNAAVKGRSYIERLEHAYSFECAAGPLANCAEWRGLKRCFERLVEKAEAAPQRPELIGYVPPGAVEETSLEGYLPVYSRPPHLHAAARKEQV